MVAQREVATQSISQGRAVVWIASGDSRWAWSARAAIRGMFPRHLNDGRAAAGLDSTLIKNYLGIKIADARIQDVA